MAIDLEAIRKRMLELSGQKKNSSVQLWKPTPGEYKIRGIPWKSTPDGMPFLERRFYYLGNTRVLAPTQFGKPDPVNDLIRKLYNSGTPDDRNLAKKLYSKMTAYMAMIVRGEESKGSLVWTLNPFLYQQMLGLFTDPDTNEVIDILDPLNGYDLKVTITPSKKFYNGKQMMDTNVVVSRKVSKLSEDPEQMKKLLDSVPDIDLMYPQKTTAEIESLLNAWLSGGASADETPSTDEGTGRGSVKTADALDELAASVKPEAQKPVVEVASKPVVAKKKKPDIDDASTGPKQSLEDAFADLMEPSDSE